MAMGRTSCFHVESLEDRNLFSVVFPNAAEQYMVALINRARANPSAEAARYSIDLNEGLSPGTISTAVKQPLAINPVLVDSSRGHTQWMIDSDKFQHDGPGTTTFDTRIRNAGYAFSGNYGAGENIAWAGQSQGAPNLTSFTAQLHKNLFVDKGIAMRGHRTNIMNGSFKEVGAGVLAATSYQGGYHAVIDTNDFAYESGNSFLTGIAYTDKVTKDKFYTPGEGLGSITVQALRLSDNATFSTTTWAAGGYALALPPGSYTVSAHGTGLGTVTYNNVTIGSENIERDFTPAATPAVVNKTALHISNITVASAKALTFTVTYTSSANVAFSSLNGADIKVTGPGAFSKFAVFLKVDAKSNGSPRTATYRIAPPTGGWKSTKNGTYTLSLQAKQVKTGAGGFFAAKALGHLLIHIV